MDHKSNRDLLHLFGIERCRQALLITGPDAVYIPALIHEWEHEVIEEGLRNKTPLYIIAQRAGVDIRTVKRHRDRLKGG